MNTDQSIILNNNKLLTAAGNSLKSFLGVGVPSTEVISDSNYRGTGNLPTSGYNFNVPSLGYDTFFSCTGLSDVIKAYQQCPPIYSIVNRQAFAYITGKEWLLDTKKNKVATTPQADKILKLLKSPNPFQNRKQFNAQMAIYLRLFGYCIVIPSGRPVGYSLEDSAALWIIPPYMCKIEYNDQSPFMSKDNYIKKIVITYGNEVTTITDISKVLIFKDATTGISNPFMSDGPIKPLQQNINNLIGIYNSKGTIINYRGALGILTPELDPNGAIASTDEEKHQLQNELQQYGIRSGQWKFIIANSAMKWQSMGVSASELQLNEWAANDTMVCCDGLVFPYKLLANEQSGSLAGSEMNDWKKVLYQDFVMPFADNIDEQWTSFFSLEEVGLYFNTDYTHVACLQEDDLKNAQARGARNTALLIEFQNNMLTLNMWLELNNEDPWKGTGGFGDKYYYELIEAGWKFGGASGVTVAPVTDPNATGTLSTGKQ